jgi:hypothetical protein
MAGKPALLAQKGFAGGAGAGTLHDSPEPVQSIAQPVELIVLQTPEPINQ